MTYSPNIVAQSPNLMPRDCIGWCGSNAYAMIAPTPSNAYMYYCACANTKPSAVYSSSYCNFGCPGSTSWNPPPCGGYDSWAGYIAWSVYATNAVVPQPPAPVRTTTKAAAPAPPPPRTTVPPKPVGPQPQNPANNPPVEPQIPIETALDPENSVLPNGDGDSSATKQAASENGGASVSFASSSNSTSDFTNIALPVGGTPQHLPMTVAGIATNGNPQKPTSGGPQNLAIIIGGSVGAVVVLAIGVAVVAKLRSNRRVQERREFIPPVPMKYQHVEDVEFDIEMYSRMTPSPPESPLPVPASLPASRTRPPRSSSARKPESGLSIHPYSA